MLLESNQVFEFSLPKEGGEPELIEKTTEKFVALKTGAVVRRYEGYDANSEIVLTDWFTHKGQQYRLNKTCGDYEADGIFYSDAQLCLFKLPFQQIGEIQNLSVHKKYRDIRYFTSVYFNDLLPAVRKKITFIVPEWLEISLKEFNFENCAIQKQERYDASQKAHIYEYAWEKIPAFADEENTLGNSHIYPHLLILSKAYSLNGEKKNILSSIDDLYAWYSTLIHDLSFDEASLQDQLDALIRNTENDLDKIRNIYYWVQDNIRYIAFEDGIAAFKPDRADEVYRKKFGDCKGMANLTKSLLKMAGFDARLTWIGTHHLAYDYSLPSLAVDNHMICTVMLDNKKYILDATEKFIALEDYAERIQGRPILIENGSSYLIDKVPLYNYQRNLCTYHQQLKFEDQSLVGSCRIELNGEPKNRLLYSLNMYQEQKQKEIIQAIINPEEAYITDKLEYSALNDRESPFTIHFDLSSAKAVTTFGSDLYIDIDPTKEFGKLKIDSTQIHDYYFGEKILRKGEIQLKIPEGYSVQHIPESFNLEHSHFTFQIRFEQTADAVIYHKTISVPQGIIKKEHFDEWNSFINTLNKTYEDQIILVKQP